MPFSSPNRDFPISSKVQSTFSLCDNAASNSFCASLRLRDPSGALKTYLFNNQQHQIVSLLWKVHNKK